MLQDLLQKPASKPFLSNPRCSHEEVGSWEKTWGVRLPEGYRTFLLELADGGRMTGGYTDFVLFPLRRVRATARAAEPFALGRSQVQERLAAARHSPTPRPIFPEFSHAWDEEEEAYPPGCLWIGRYPSFDSLFLVTSGELRGTVWCGVDGGLPERAPDGTPMTFVPWLIDAYQELCG
ncbi:MAG: SMI1/KNR4 family protein [Myxococcota bacterium]